MCVGWDGGEVHVCGAGVGVKVWEDLGGWLE